jgi:hypothetical protein
VVLRRAVHPPAAAEGYGDVSRRLREFPRSAALVILWAIVALLAVLIIFAGRIAWQYTAIR